MKILDASDNDLIFGETGGSDFCFHFEKKKQNIYFVGTYKSYTISKYSCKIFQQFVVFKNVKYSTDSGVLKKYNFPSL